MSGAHRDEIVFTGSVSHGLNIVAAGLDWQPGDNLVCAETEFTANVYPWTNLRRRGVEVRFAPACDNCVLVEDVAALMDDRTRLMAISFVEFATGYRNDLDALASLCHQRGAYLCVDGIQGLGALQLSVTQTTSGFPGHPRRQVDAGPHRRRISLRTARFAAPSRAGDDRLAVGGAPR